MIDQLCQAYHWTMGEAMSLTMPQIIMLNHAASVNSKRMEQRMKRKHTTTDNQEGYEPVYNGKTLDEMTSDEMVQYYAQGV